MLEILACSDCEGRGTRKSHTVVKDNSFCIKKGEIFGLLGPNGAGKSTTFQMMCALLKPTSGSGYIMGIDVAKESAKARKYLGYMAQKFSLYQRLSVVDNLEFYAGCYGLFGKDKKEKIYNYHLYIVPLLFSICEGALLHSYSTIIRKYNYFEVSPRNQKEN